MIVRRQGESAEVVEEAEEELSPQSSPRHPEPVHCDEKTKETFTEAPIIEEASPNLRPVLSHVSTHDGTGVHHQDQHYEAGDEIYNKFSHVHKVTMVTVLSMSSFLAPISSTSILAASPEVVATYNTTGAIFNISNALYMIFMGFSALVYGPLGTTYVRSHPSHSSPWRETRAKCLLSVFREGNGHFQSQP